MPVISLNKHNVFSQLAKIVSLLDSCEELKISYTASEESDDVPTRSYGSNDRSTRPAFRKSTSFGTRPPRKTSDDGEKKSYSPKASAGPKRFSPQKKTFSSSSVRGSTFAGNKKGNPGRGYKKSAA